MRRIDALYHDPLDLVWLATARELGIEVRRDAGVFASWDGQGVLWIGTPETLDPDDCLAQLIFHELCHALVEGPASLELPDWGLENIDARHESREHACLRLQATLAERYGLREFLAATTDYREYYDRLPADPLAGDEPSAQLAREAWTRATTGPWAKPLHRALQATAILAATIAPYAPPGSLWQRYRAEDRSPQAPGSARVS